MCPVEIMLAPRRGTVSVLTEGEFPNVMKAHRIFTGKMGTMGNLCSRQNKSDSERQMSYFLS